MAYRKIFMRVDANNVGFEERLTEVVLYLSLALTLKSFFLNSH